MSNFNPEKLFVTYKDGVTATGPIIPRRYTLTHSDVTGDLFLTIGCQYAWENINAMGDIRRNKAELGTTFTIVFIYILIRANMT